MLRFRVFLPVFAASAAVSVAQTTGQSSSTAMPASATPAGPTVAAASGNPLHVIFTNLATSTTSDVPGLPGAKFAGASVSTAFDRPWVSRNGLHWALRADTDQVSTADQVVLIDGTLAQREGDPAPFAVGQTLGIFDVRIGINDSGSYAFFNNLGSTTTNDDYVVRVDTGPVYTVVAQEGQPIPALPTSTYDDDLEGVVLLNSGDVAVAADLIDGGGITTAMDEVLVNGATLVAQEGVTIPTGQAGGGAAAWENFSFEDQWFDNAGNVLIFGDLLGATTDDNVVVYNGAVVLQENQIIPGSGFLNPIDLSGIVEVGMDHGGNWFARGNNDTTEQDWVVRNGTVIASEGSPVLTSPGRYRVLAATLDPLQVVPPAVSTGSGTAAVTVDTLDNVIYFTITTTSLTSAETAADIHGFAAAGANAPALYPLPLGTPKSGSVSYLEADEASILAGLTYVSIDTVGFPGGEIRGQLNPVTEVYDDRDFSDCFFLHVGNSLGDWVVGATTNGSALRNGVLALNGTVEVAREGEPIDVDNNGLFDDDAFLNTFGNDDAFLRDDGTLVFVATIRNAAGVQTGHGVFERSTQKNIVSYCSGDGLDPQVTTGCPCGNTGASGNGCASSFNPAGAHITTSGAVATDDVVLLGSGMQATGICIFLKGTAIDPFGFVFGDGITCTGGSLLRLRAVALSGGGAGFPLPPETITLSARGSTPVGSGITASYTVFYRNAAAGFCPPLTFNVANSVRILW